MDRVARMGSIAAIAAAWIVGAGLTFASLGCGKEKKGGESDPVPYTLFRLKNGSTNHQVKSASGGVETPPPPRRLVGPVAPTFDAKDDDASKTITIPRAYANVKYDTSGDLSDDSDVSPTGVTIGEVSIELLANDTKVRFTYRRYKPNGTEITPVVHEKDL